MHGSAESGAQAAAPVAIVGGGPLGMALALALHGRGVAATVFDARRRAAAADDPRVLALAYGSRLILESLGVWDSLPATPIETIHISHQGGFGRTRLSACQLGVPALGYVVGAGPLAAALDAALLSKGIEVRDQRRAIGVEATDGVAHLRLAGDETVITPLVAWAEGSIADIAAKVRNYGQQATICSAETVEPHHGLAYERFTPEGPLAVLPCGKAWSVVFTASDALAHELISLDDTAFLARLQQQFGSRLRFVRVGPRVAYPLSLRVRRDPVGTRQVWLGNAAQTLHPVAGQGFNLALRDLSELALQVATAAAVGEDYGRPATLASYARARRMDRGGVIAFTDTLARLFSNNQILLRQARGLGLLALDLLPPARSFVAKRMMFGGRAWP